MAISHLESFGKLCAKTFGYTFTIPDGYVTKTDLSKIGNLFVMGLFGLIIASVMSIFIQTPGYTLALMYVGVVIFIGLIGYDTQKIKQFAYAGIDIYGLLADSMGVTREEASNLDVTYEMLSEALAKASDEGGKYAGAMEAQSQTYNGAISNLQESFQVFTGQLSEGLFNAIKNIIPKFIFPSKFQSIFDIL